MKTLVLDCNALCHKAKHAFSDLSIGTTGTGVIYGFFNDILKLARKYRTNDLVFIWDSPPETSLRSKIYPEYKSNRRGEKSPEDQEIDAISYPQFEMIRKEILPKLGAQNIFREDGYEGDDLIAAIVQEYEGDFIIVSTDQDLYQLLFDDGNEEVYASCKIWDPRKKKEIGRKELYEEYGMTPYQWGLFKTIGGCSSDNVKGVPGFGKKASFEYATNTLHPKKGQKLLLPSNQEIIERNKKLVLLPFNGTPVFDLKSPEPWDLDEVLDFCDDFGLASLQSGTNLEIWKEWLCQKVD